MNTDGPNATEFDAVVLGGGPAGAAAALTLARAGRRVLLAEAAGTSTAKIGEMLPPAGYPLLRDLGVWDAFRKNGHLPCYGNQSSWGSEDLDSTDFIYDLNGHGWHLDRPRFDSLLRHEAQQAGASVYNSTIARKFTRSKDDGRWVITLSNDQGTTRVCSGWLVDSTGRRAIVARNQGRVRINDDSLVGIFATFKVLDNSSERDEDSRTLIEAAPDGWWYTGLLPSKRRVVAYMTDADLVPSQAHTGDGFLSLMNQTTHIRPCLSRYEYVVHNAPKGAQAQSSRLDGFVGDGWLAAGDAAISFDPLSSQGLITALYTGMRAGRALNEQLSGDSDSLSEYSSNLQTIYDKYLQHRTEYYVIEERWKERPFWARRM